MAVPVAAALVALAAPANQAMIGVQSTPVALITLAASFLVFGLGTLAALTKNRWLKNTPRGQHPDI